MNEAIHRHQQSNEPNAFMLEQFQEMKSRLTGELERLLSQLTETQWQVAV